MTQGKHRGEPARTTGSDRRYMAAHEALWRNAAAEQATGIDYETPEYEALNREASEAAKGVRRSRQFFLDGRVMRKLDRDGVRV